MAPRPGKAAPTAPRAPERGDVVWLTFDPQAGHEQAGRRPAVVLSPRAYNERVSRALMCPVTSRSKGYPFEVELPAGLPVAGMILADQVRSLDWRARRAELVCALPAETLAAVLHRVRLLLE